MGQTLSYKDYNVSVVRSEEDEGLHSRDCIPGSWEYGMWLRLRARTAKS
jgi:hypothetical protein